MSTSNTTESCICACKRKRGPLGYTPGGSIFAKIVTGRRAGGWKAQGTPGPAREAQHLPDEVLGVILSFAVRQNDALSVLKLSMTSRACRRVVQEDWQTWLALYSKCMTAVFRHMSMHTLPNFRRRVHCMWVQKEIRDNQSRQRRPLLLKYMQRIVVLKNVRCCGQCGSTRHAVTPFWSLGMALCRYCVQDHLVTDAWLYETCFMTFTEAWASRIRGVVFYFREHLTARQRTEFTLDKLAFKPSRPVFTFFFWRPHLEQIMDLKAMQSASLQRHAAAGVLRAAARRSIVMHKMSRMRGISLRDKRPIHARLIASDRTGTPVTWPDAMFPKHEVLNLLVMGEDFIHEQWASALAVGRPHI